MVDCAAAFDTSTSSLAGRFDTQHDEAILAREFLLRQQSSERRIGDQRRGHTETLRLAGSPRVAIRVELAFARRAGSMPDHLLWPDDVVEDVTVVETVDVVLSRLELASLPAAIHVVPCAE